MSWLSHFIHYLVPFTCIFCGAKSDRKQDLCAACYHTLPELGYACSCCAHPLQVYATLPCGQCLKVPPFFDRTFAAYRYEGLLLDCIHALKFRGSLIAGRILGELLLEKIQTLWYEGRALPHQIIPMPLHAERLRARGFNQALEIALPVSKRLSIPMNATLITRTKSTFAQARLNATQRRSNVKHAFQINEKAIASVPKHIAILDDVMTTGHTLNACARVLRQYGVEQIDI